MTAPRDPGASQAAAGDGGPAAGLRAPAVRPAAPPRKPLSRGAKVALGCGGALGAAGLLVVVAIVVSWLYLFSTAAQVALDPLVGPETLGVVQVRGNLDDPGIAALADAFAAGMDKGGPPLPPQLQWLDAYRRANNRRGIGFVVPKEIFVLLEQPKGEKDARLVCAINPRVLPRMYTIGLGMLGGSSAVRHGKHTLLQIPGGSAFCLAGGTVLFGNEKALGQVLDRLAPGAASGNAELLGALRAVRGERDGEIALRLAPETLGALSAAASPPETDCGIVSGTIDVVTPGGIDVRTEVRCPRDAEDLGAFADSALAPLARSATPGGASISPAVSVQEDRVLASLRIEGLDVLLRESLFTPPRPAPSAPPASPSAATPAPDPPSMP
ncbi:MAG: hypothetical protein U0166_20650 [Acidobacteriota bacterium]